MMLSIPAGVRIYLALEPCDMRRGFDGLALLVQQALCKDPFCGHLIHLPRERGRTRKNSLRRSERHVPVRQEAGARPFRLANHPDAGRHGGTDAGGTVPASGGAGLASHRAGVAADCSGLTEREK